MPTIDAQIADTFALVSAVHARPCILVTDAGMKAGNPPPRRVVLWPQGWTMEPVVSWIARADEAAKLVALGTAQGRPFADAQALTAHWLTQKSYVPTHEGAAVILVASTACGRALAQLLNALCAVVRDPANGDTPLFTRIAAGLDRRHARFPAYAAMTFDCFEGAGTGKTHNLVGCVGEIVQDGALGEGHKLLALTSWREPSAPPAL